MPWPLVISAVTSLLGAAAAAKGASSVSGVNFGKSPYNTGLGADYGRFLGGRLNTPAVESPVFEQYTGLVRSQARNVTRSMEQKVKDAFPAGKNREYALKMLLDLRRGEQEAVASGSKEILIALEKLRDEGVFQYLAGQAGDINARNTLRLKQATQSAQILQSGAGQLMGFMSPVVKSAAGGFG